MHANLHYKQRQIFKKKRRKTLTVVTDSKIHRKGVGEYKLGKKGGGAQRKGGVAQRKKKNTKVKKYV